MRKSAFVSLILTICTICNYNADGSLELVNIVFRHGERSPTETYPNDPYINYSWPGGLGQLNNRGKIQMYTSGLNLRKEYNDFLGPYYDVDDVIMYTSYSDRCHMSGQLLVAGLYPPKDEQIWNDELFWQPIPAHEYPREQDNKIAMKKPCPKYDEALKEIYKSPKIVEVNENNKELYEYLAKYTGTEINDILSLEFLYNTLEIEDINNLTLPNWTENIYPDQMKDLAALSLAVFTDTTLMKRLHGGPLAKEIMESMLAKEQESFNKRKLILYSSHDVTLVTLLRTLGFQELIKPEFGAALIIELHKEKEQYYVKFFYRSNGSGGKAEIKLPGCGSLCKLHNLNEVLEEVIPINWEDECLINK